MSVHGTSSFLEQPSREGWRQVGGAFRERSWEGPASRKAQFLASELPQGYSEYSVEGSGDLIVIRAVYTADTPERIGNPTSDGLVKRYWELDGDDLETSLWALPSVVAEISTQTVQQAALFRAAVESALSGESEWVPLATNVDNLVKRLAQGTDSFLESKFVLRKVETVQRNASIRPSFTNLNRWFSYAALLSSEPSLSYENLIQASGLTDLVWLKATPTVKPTQNGLWQITQEFKGAKAWDTWIYAAAS